MSEGSRPPPSPVTSAVIFAVIFDLDGVLVDSEPVHLRASRRLVAPHDLSERDYAPFIGAAIEPFATWIRDRYLPDLTVEQVRDRYSDAVYDELTASTLAPLDGARELVDAVRERGRAVAVASQSTARWVRATLAAAGMAELFETVVTAEAVTRGKPAPDIYLHTAGLLGAPPGACLAIEDSEHGVASAHAAGMTVVQSTQATPSARRQPGAHFVVASLRDFDLAWLDGTPSR